MPTIFILVIFTVANFMLGILHVAYVIANKHKCPRCTDYGCIPKKYPTIPTQPTTPEEIDKKLKDTKK